MACVRHRQIKKRCENFREFGSAAKQSIGNKQTNKQTYFHLIIYRLLKKNFNNVLQIFRKKKKLKQIQVIIKTIKYFSEKNLWNLSKNDQTAYKCA